MKTFIVFCKWAKEVVDIDGNKLQTKKKRREEMYATYYGLEYGNDWGKLV